jgi:hypothetical protein
MAEIIEFKNDLHWANLPTQHGTIPIHYDGCFLGDDDGKYYFHHKGHASGWIYETFEYNEGANNWIREHGFEKFRKTYNL